jgi:hypothetical protein
MGGLKGGDCRIAGALETQLILIIIIIITIIIITISTISQHLKQFKTSSICNSTSKFASPNRTFSRVSILLKTHSISQTSCLPLADQENTAGFQNAPGI